VLKIVTSIVDLVSFQDNIVSCDQFNSSPKAIALGNFDGIHQGHQKVIEPIFNAQSSKDISPCLVTFIPHPQEFFSGEQKKLLTPILEKSILLEQLGIEQLILLPFDRELANLTPQEFVLDILIKKINATFISIGEDFRFGYKRQGNAQDLKSIANQHNVKVNITTEQKILLCKNFQRVSSSHIRKCLDEGKISLANHMLGREYQLIGKVIKGKQLGRTIGFPTANLAIPSEKFLPQNGVYAVKVNLSDDRSANIPAVMNIGNRPTINGENLSVEVHLLDWQGDLYGKTLLVKLLDFIRPEYQFASLQKLKEQIELDCQKAKKQIFS
jgi:riboflavin kinase/FMN adenylyltransferase